MSNLLMIDDNEIDHFITKKMLEKYELFTSKEHLLNGKDALTNIQKNLADEHNLPDVIFLDLTMPQFNGWEFLEKFKTLIPAIKKKVEVYVVTSSINPLHKAKSEEYNFVKGYLLKPLNKETLLRNFSPFKQEHHLPELAVC